MVHYPYTVMYRIVGAALAGDVSYTDANGTTVNVPYASFPWKKYLHPKKGTRLSVFASMDRAYPGADIETPGVIVEIWVNGRRIGWGSSFGDPRHSTHSETILGR